MLDESKRKAAGPFGRESEYYSGESDNEIGEIFEGVVEKKQVQKALRLIVRQAEETARAVALQQEEVWSCEFQP